jgi:hypothetical protein
MPLEFAPQCCDADFYLMLGQGCADSLSWCWHPLRPIGAQLYFSLPFRLGLAKQWLIPLNALLVLASVWIGTLALGALVSKRERWHTIFFALACGAVHVFFVFGLIRNSLSDLPAAVGVLASIWMLVLGTLREDKRLYVASGAALGMGVITRAFYLYPALANVALVCLLTARKKPARALGLRFAIAFAAPIALQFYVTHAFTHDWSFIDRASTKAGEQLHFETITYGYDTLLPARGYRYDAAECFHESATMADAFRRHEWGEALCLVARRQWFYFGSYTTTGKVYLTDAAERRFSTMFLAANVLAALAAVAFVFRTVKRLPILLALAAMLGCIWAEGSGIIPEARFMVVLYVAMWLVAIAFAVDLAPCLISRVRIAMERRNALRASEP